MNENKVEPKIISKALGSYAQQYQYGHYLLPCGHSQDIKKQHVKSNRYRCRECLLLEYKAQAQSCGLEVIDFKPTSDTNYKRYKFIGCGHERILDFSAVKNKSVECTECINISRNEAATRNNLILIDLNDCSKWMHRQYKYCDCGHIQSIKLQDVSNDKIPKCIECKKLRWQDEASNAGLKLLSACSEDTGYSNYLLPCGCTQKFKIGNIRYNKWACKEHSNFWTKPSNVYLISFTTESKSWLKLGVSANVKQRILDYKLKCKYDASVIISKTFQTYKQALDFEKFLHNKYKENNILHSEMKEYMQNGWSECYDLSLIDTLYQEILRHE
jgi:hypothetical protein